MGQNHNSKQSVQNWHKHPPSVIITYEKNTIKLVLWHSRLRWCIELWCSCGKRESRLCPLPIQFPLIIYNPFSIFTIKNNGKNTLTLRIGQHTLDLASCTGSLSPMIIWAAWMRMELIVDMQDLDYGLPVCELLNEARWESMQGMAISHRSQNSEEWWMRCHPWRTAPAVHSASVTV